MRPGMVLKWLFPSASNFQSLAGPSDQSNAEMLTFLGVFKGWEEVRGVAFCLPRLHVTRALSQSTFKDRLRHGLRN